MNHKSISCRIVAASLILAASLNAEAVETLPVYDDIGGDFRAESTLDRKVSLSDYRGKAVLIFFGYTSCQDICPATMGHLRSLMSNLGTASDEVQVLFVTVDPETDTAEHLKEYLARFDSRFVGVTGTIAEVKNIAERFMIEHDPSHEGKVTTAHHKAKTFTDESFLYAHSQQIYLLDGVGRTRAIFYTGSPLVEMEAAVRTLLN